MGWAKCKLSDVCQFESGFAFKSESYKKEGVPLIRISNIKDGTITTDGGVCIQEVVESRFHVVKGDLLIALSGATTGKMGVYDKDDDALLNQRVGNLRVISKTCFLPEYRNLFMESQTATILEQAWGGAQPNISPNTIIGFDILLPPYAEQCRIVCKANELLALVYNIKFVQDQIETGVDDIKTKVLDLAIHGKLVSQDPSDEPAINLLRRINPDFKASDNLHYEGIPNSWTVCKLSDVCLDFIVPQRDKPKVFDGDIPWCRIEDIEGKYLNGSLSGRLVSMKTIQEMNMRICPVGTVICSCSASIGTQALVTRPCCTNQTFIGLVPDERVIFNEFLYYFLSSQTEHFLEIGTGTTIKYISREKFEEYRIPLPPLSEQRRIVERIEYCLSLFKQIQSATSAS